MTTPYRPRVYICGPISRGNLAENINQATEAFAKLAKAGFAPFCPHWSVYSAEPATPHPSDKVDRVYTVGSAAGYPGLEHSDWIGIDLPWVAVSQAVLRLPGESKGADLEVECAMSYGIPVFPDVESLIQYCPWFLNND